MKRNLPRYSRRAAFPAAFDGLLRRAPARLRRSRARGHAPAPSCRDDFVNSHRGVRRIVLSRRHGDRQRLNTFSGHAERAANAQATAVHGKINI
jgi:hypothetical protein